MSADLVPADGIAALEHLDPTAREVAVTQYLTDARDRLACALQATGPEAVAAIKAEIATAAEATKQLGLSKEIQADAQEMVRRAEYTLGKAINAAEQRGEIARMGERRDLVAEHNEVPKPTATEVAHVNNRSDLTLIRRMTEVSEAEFEAALSDARAEGNLSRTNVVRKIKGQTPEPPSERPDELRGRRHIDAVRVIDQTVLAASNIVSPSLLAQVDFAELHRDNLGEWISSLSESIRALQALKRSLEKELNRVGV